MRINEVIKMLYLAILCIVAVTPLPCLADDTVFFVVRHADKLHDTDASPLSPAGEKRAEQLAQTLEHLKVDAIYTTPVVRTRDTAKPLATKMHITPTEYDNPTPMWIDSVVLAQRGKRTL